MSEQNKGTRKAPPIKRRNQRRAWPHWRIAGAGFIALLLLSGALTLACNVMKSDGPATAKPQVPVHRTEQVVPMVSKEDLATCGEQISWNDWFACMAQVDPQLLAHFDDNQARAKLSLRMVEDWMKKFPGKDARVIFVYPSADNWSDDQIREAAAADVHQDVSHMQNLRIYKVSQAMPGWDIWNTRKLEEHIYSPFHDTRTDVDQVRVSLAPLNAEGNIDLSMAGSGVFVSCGNEHWLELVMASTSVAPSTPEAHFAPPTSNQPPPDNCPNGCTPPPDNCTTHPELPGCGYTPDCTTNPELPGCTPVNCVTNPELPGCTPPPSTCPPGYTGSNGLCKSEYTRGPEKVIPSWVPRGQMTVDPSMREPSTASETPPPVYSAPPSSLVVVPAPNQGGPTQPATPRTTVRPAESAAPATSAPATLDLSGTT